jgi:hypothetical protein
MSLFHYHKPKEKTARKELENFLIDKIDDNYYDQFQKLLDSFRQAVFNHGIAQERENNANQ